MICDVHGTGWSIAGLDVKPFPAGDTKQAKQEARYVRANLNAGKLEHASKAEFEEAHDDALEQEVLRQVPDYREKASAIQEGQLQAVVKETAERVAAKLGVDEDAVYEAMLEADKEGRRERLDEAREQDLGTDDPEKQVARTTGQSPKASDKKGKGKKAKDAPAE
jgi:hypothetical protein